MDFEKVKEIIGKHVDGKGLALDVAKEIIFPALKAFAEKSENKIDDVAVELLVSAIEKALA